MITFAETTVFNASAQTIVNTVNCRGVMGSGLALEFKLRYPLMFEDYTEKCKRNEVRIGRPYIYRVDESFQILNFPTKDHWRYPSKLEWIEQGMRHFDAHQAQMSISSIAFPLLGCSRGSLDWQDVKPIMKKYLQGLSYPVVICQDSETQATGLEGLMVSAINNPSPRASIHALHLKPEITQRIFRSLPIRRFRDLLRIQGVGRDTYEKLFQYFYHIAQSIESQQPTSDPKSNSSTQLELFDQP